MTQASKIHLSASRDIPFNKLVLSQSNVRRVKAGLSIEDLAADIAQRTLLQSLCVRPMRNADGNVTGMFEVPACMRDTSVADGVRKIAPRSLRVERVSNCA